MSKLCLLGLVSIRVFLWLIDKTERYLGVFGFEDRVISFSVARYDLVYVVLRLWIRRHALVLVHCPFTGVVTSEGQLHIAIESFQKPGQIFCSRLDVTSLIFRIVAMKSFCRAGQQLHQAARPRGRERIRIVI